MKIMDRIYDIIIFNHKNKKLASNLLASRITNKNPVYNHLYRKEIEKKTKKYENVPFRVMIENTNDCNYSCTFCPHKTMKRKVGFMNISLYKKIIDECKSLGIEYVTIYGFGEPLLDREFVSKVKYAKSVGIKRVTTNTNGSLLTPETSKKLIDAKMDEIFVSVDAASEDSYSKIRPNHSLEIVEKNIKDLVDIRKEARTTKPFVFLSFVKSEINKKEVKRFISKWDGIVDGVSISKIHNWTGDIKHGRDFKMNKKDPCRLLWTEFVISWDGIVALCCNDYENRVVMGNVNEQSIEDVWKGEKFRMVRNFHMQGKFSEIPICKDCEYNYHDKSNWWVSK